MQKILSIDTTQLKYPFTGDRFKSKFVGSTCTCKKSELGKPILFVLNDKEGNPVREFSLDYETFKRSAWEKV